MNTHSQYLSAYFDPKRLNILTQAAIEFLTKQGVQFDAIAFRGVSGALLAPILACALDSAPGLIVVRKEESRHSSLDVEGRSDVESYIIVDDQIDTGSTVDAIVSGVESLANGARCQGILLYNECGYSYSGGADYGKIPVWVRTRQWGV